MLFSRKWKKKEYHFEEPVYRTCRQLFIGYTEEEFEKEYWAPPENDDFVTGTRAFTLFRDWSCLVWVNPNEEGDDRRVVIIHELCHVVSRRMKDRGIVNDNDAGEEAYAFMYEYYARELIKHKLI